MKINRIIALLTIFFCVISCNTPKEKTIVDELEINVLLDNWHLSASTADFDSYFNALSDSSIYIGTDASEHWTKDEFISFSKPYFDKGKAWDFKAFERHIYSSENGDVVWFDELLNTWMGVCRGSGVLVNEQGNWKIKHYHLSVTIANENVKDFIAIPQK